ncbi:3239_t:CDS:1, partial [Dentiscutata erythropus]
METQVERVVLGIRKVDERTFYFDTLWNRLFYYRLFQEKSNFKNFELQDILIHLKITSYHNRVQGSTINIPVTK